MAGWKETWQNGIRMKKLEVGCLWNFAKRLKNRKVMSFLTKDDALEDLSFATKRQNVLGEGSEIWLDLGSKRGWELGFFANNWLRVDLGSIVCLGIFN